MSSDDNPSIEPVADGSLALSASSIDFINDFKIKLSREIRHGQDYGGLLTAIRHHLDHFEQDVKAVTVSNSHTLANIWGAVTPKQDESNDLKIQITGPAPGDLFEVVATSASEVSYIVKYVAGLDAACQRMKEICSRCIQIQEKRRELEGVQLSLKQPADMTVDDHIKLLRRYNKTKDVGQQLIGLIAENRGVPVGSLYSNEDYGVGYHD